MSKSKDSPFSSWREGRRFRAWSLYEKGWKQKDIAEALGVTTGAVCQWIKRAKTEGKEALRTRRPTGRPCRLSQEQLEQLPSLLEKGAEAFGFRGEVWTTARVAEIIKQEFGVSYHRDHVSRLLRKVGWSIQKPKRRATQRNEEKIAE